MYFNFFTHSSVDRHLGCFHVLATINSVPMNIGVHVSFFNCGFSQAICSGAGFLGHMIVLFLVF